MPTVSISEAARLAGVSRKTVQRHISSGKLSATLSQGADAGMRQVEISELMRVYGSLDAPVPETKIPQVPSLSGQGDALGQVIEAQKETIDLLKKHVDELTTEKRELRAQVVGLLEYRKQMSEASAPENKSKRMIVMWGLLIVGVTAIAVLTIPLWGRPH